MKDSDSEVKSFHVKPQQPPHQEENYYITLHTYNLSILQETLLEEKLTEIFENITWTC